MSFADLTPQDKNVIYQCLKAVVEGPFIPDWEFHILFGRYRNEVKEVMDSWSEIDPNSENTQIAINNSLNNLLGYPHKRFDIWSDYISVSPSEVAEIYRKWRSEDGLETGGHGYFNRMM